MRQALFFVSVILLGIGIYLKFFYDVPDTDQAVNFFTGWFFIIIGIASLLINIFWSSPKKTK
jgi:vacuolar-type H+-ATPase subunit I/STV1